MPFALEPPIEPMLATPAPEIPLGDGWLYEPKWDGFRVLVFKDGEDLYLQSREKKPLLRYFPDLEAPLRRELPARCVADGELVVMGQKGLDFDALLTRIHPAASRIRLLAQEKPASLVLFDLLAIGERDLRPLPLAERRAALEAALLHAHAPAHLTPATNDAKVAADWFRRFEGAGLDGVVAKRLADPYQPGARAMVKVKHARTADCAVAGFRWHKDGPGTHVGSLLLGLYDEKGTLQHVGVCSGFSVEKRKELKETLLPLRAGEEDPHPWRGRDLDGKEGPGQRVPGGQTRWSRGKDLSWEPVRIEKVVEVAYDHLQGDRFRHATRLVRFRPDRTPSLCRYDQLEATPPFELSQIFGAHQAS